MATAPPCRENGIARKHEWGWIHSQPGPQVDQGREGMEAPAGQGITCDGLTITDNDSTALGVLQACEPGGSEGA